MMIHSEMVPVTLHRYIKTLAGGTVGAAYYDHGQYDQPLIMTNLLRSEISPFKILRLI